MPVITLTTDWGITDYYVSALKGDIHSALPEVSVVDISHQVKRDNILHGAFIFKNAWHHFPKGTVHINGFTGSTEAPVLIAISHEGHFFVGPDDGFYSLVFKDMPENRYYILNAQGEKVRMNAKAIASSGVFLSKGGKIEEMGEKMIDFTSYSLLQAVTEDHVIRGTVIHIDIFGNLVTNIEKELFERIAKGRAYNIILKSREYAISNIMEDYYNVPTGYLVAHYNDTGMLEIAINKGDASQLIGMKYGDIVRVEFK